MIAQIFQEWLYWFDAQMEGRIVALLIDDFSAHESGLEIVKEEGDYLMSSNLSSCQCHQLLSATGLRHHPLLEGPLPPSLGAVHHG